jgi:hypothetical protein
MTGTAEFNATNRERHDLSKLRWCEFFVIQPMLHMWRHGVFCCHGSSATVSVLQLSRFCKCLNSETLSVLQLSHFRKCLSSATVSVLHLSVLQLPQFCNSLSCSLWPDTFRYSMVRDVVMISCNSLKYICYPYELWGLTFFMQIGKR